MSRHKLTLLSVAAAVLLAAVLIGGVWLSYFTGQDSSFSLPPPLPVPSSLTAPVTGQSSGKGAYTPLTVDAGNIREVLLTVKRPEVYSQVITCHTYWAGGEKTTVHLWARRGEYIRVETQQEGVPTQNRLTANGHVYVWTGDNRPYYSDLSPEEMESLAGIPTWEDVAELPSGSIIEAEYIVLPGMRCLRVKTQEPVYTAEYKISLETGLLVSAEYTGADGSPAFSCYAEPPEMGDPGEERFRLPDGKAPE